MTTRALSKADADLTEQCEGLLEGAVPATRRFAIRCVAPFLLEDTASVSSFVLAIGDSILSVRLTVSRCLTTLVLSIGEAAARSLSRR